MKKILYLILLVGTSSCGLLSELSKFDMPYDQSVTIPKEGIVVDMPISVLTADIETKSAEFLKTNNIKQDLIDNITLRKIDIDITLPVNSNFDFIKSVNISILADGLTETNVAWSDSLTNFTGSSLKLKIDPMDLKSFILKDKIKFRVDIVANHTISSNYTVDIKPTFLIDLKVLGL